MVRYLRARMLTLYVIRSDGKGWGAAYDLARKECDDAFTELLHIAYPLAYAEA